MKVVQFKMNICYKLKDANKILIKCFDSLEGNINNYQENVKGVIKHLFPESQKDIFGTILPFLKNQYEISSAMEELELIDIYSGMEELELHVIKQEVDQQDIPDPKKRKSFNIIEVRSNKFKENAKNIKMNNISRVFHRLLQERDWVNIKNINYEIYKWKILKLSPLMEDLKALETDLFNMTSANQKKGI